MNLMTKYNDKLLMVCISLIVIIFYHTLTSQDKPITLVSVDITKLSKEWIVELANNNNNSEKNSGELNKRIELLKNILAEEASENHWVILPSQNILSGAEDVTSFINEVFSKKIQEK